MNLLAGIWDTPWKISNEVWRWLAYPRVRLVFAANGLPWEPSRKCYGVPIIQRHRQSRMTLGARMQLRSSVHSNPLGPYRPVILVAWRPGAQLIIGDDFGMTGGTICAAESITIGQRVAVGANSTIMDTDFHPLDPVERRSHPADARAPPRSL